MRVWPWIAVFCLAIVGGTAHAEPNIEVGLKGGLNVAKVTGESLEGLETSTKTGALLGGFARLNFGDRWALQQEFMYAERGGKLSFADTSITGTPFTLTQLNMNYLELPFLGIFKITTGKIVPQVYLGAQVGVTVRSNAVGDSLNASTGNTDEFDLRIGNSKGVDFAPLLGAAVEFKTDGRFRFFVDGRYVHGTVDQYQNRSPFELDPNNILFNFNPNDVFLGNNSTGEAAHIENRGFSFGVAASILL